MTITLSKIKSIERKAEAMRYQGDSFEFWNEEELEQFSGVKGMDAWSDKQLRDVLKYVENNENRMNRLLDSP